MAAILTPFFAATDSFPCDGLISVPTNLSDAHQSGALPIVSTLLYSIHRLRDAGVRGSADHPRRDDVIRRYRLGVRT